jgi:hypothetical protein
MAKPIKETPTLTGKDAAKFSNQIKRSEINRPTDTELKKMYENFKKLASITQTSHVISTRTRS